MCITILKKTFVPASVSSQLLIEFIQANECSVRLCSDTSMAGADDSTHNMERSVLQTGWGSSRLSDAQLHCQGKRNKLKRVKDVQIAGMSLCCNNTCLVCVCCGQLISDAGYQGEITSVSTACQQLEVFSRVLRTSLATLLDGGEQNLEKNLPEFAVSTPNSFWGNCIGLWLYVFSQISFLCVLWAEDGVSWWAHILVCSGDDVHPRSGGAGRFCNAANWTGSTEICPWEVHSKRWLICLIDLPMNNNHVIELFAVSRGHDASQITLALGTAAAYPRACQALGAMLSKGALNPADITVLFKMFSSMDPPPVELVRIYIFHLLFSRCYYPKWLTTEEHKSTIFVVYNARFIRKLD